MLPRQTSRSDADRWPAFPRERFQRWPSSQRTFTVYPLSENIVDCLGPLGQISGSTTDKYDLGKIPNLHSLMPYSQEARKPVFDCTGADGLVGAHIKTARESRDHFDSLAQAIRAAI